MPVFISSIPTIEEDDLKLCKELLSKNNVENIDVKLPGFEDKEHYYTNTGRAALYAILKALEITKGDEVIIQSFTCMAVVVPLKWLDIKPVYADIEQETYNISLESIKGRITDKTRAIIIQHTFGIPAQIERIKEYIDEINKNRSKEKEIFLIEDCAHCLNIKKEDKYLGTYGDVSFFSFGQDKVVSTTQGGCIVSNDRELEKKIERVYKKIPDMPESMVKYNLRYPILWDLIKKVYYKPQVLANSKYFSKFTVGKFLILLFRFLGLIKSQASKDDFGDPKEGVYKLSVKQKHLLKNQLDKLERFSTHREKITEKYSRLLDLDLHGFLIRYPVLVDYPDIVKSKLQQIRVIAGNWYNYPVIPRGIDLDKVGYTVGTCPNTEYVMEHILNLPTGLDVTAKDAERIVHIVEPHLT
ncbi:MAG: DegT/DnrJ/eryc1/StrS aminotransferase [candidate division WS6 bacterium 34_10]|uniref:DegT/DnrJ/eryc1/StrS aminotransferase n=1 Tax=candidate division WS6 bacterium 34_10 TaxID=1641389 RepID=A0A101HIV8_9BACT|nr:MAG: DegT/DnrJ/eryc1/StrS aminotransferase [candidate division WS6 bacterium 34_10]